MKKFVVFSLIAVILCSISLGCGAGIEGNWVCDEVHGGYPDQMSLNEDGTGTADGYSCNWYVADNQLTITVGSIFAGTLTYEYSVSGTELYLDEYRYTRQ